MSRRIHLPKPTSGISVVDELPLFCGAKRDADTWTTCFEHRATCEACIKANRIYQEELTHRRTQAKLQAERERAARAEQDEPEQDDAVDQPSVFRGGGAVHYSKDTPGSTGKVRGRCGVWSSKWSTDPAQVTCLRCMTMTRRRALIAAAALVAAACSPLGPDDDSSTGRDTSSTTELTAGETTDDIEETTGEASTTTTGSTTSGSSTCDASTTGDLCVNVLCDPGAPNCPEGAECVALPGGPTACVVFCESVTDTCAILIADQIALCPPT